MYSICPRTGAPAGFFRRGAKYVCTERNRLIFGAPTARTKSAVFRRFKLILRVSDASTDRACENFTVFFGIIAPYKADARNWLPQLWRLEGMVGEKPRPWRPPVKLAAAPEERWKAESRPRRAPRLAVAMGEMTSYTCMLDPRCRLPKTIEEEQIGIFIISPTDTLHIVRRRSRM